MTIEVKELKKQVRTMSFDEHVSCEYSFCCDRLEEAVKKGWASLLLNADKFAVRVHNNGEFKQFWQPIEYCPFCGDKVDIFKYSKKKKTKVRYRKINAKCCNNCKYIEYNYGECKCILTAGFIDKTCVCSLHEWVRN